MASLKEENNPAPNPPKRSRIEVDEELMRRMIAEGFLWIRESIMVF